MLRNNKRAHESDSDEIESISEEGTSGSEYSPDDIDSDVEIVSSPRKKPNKGSTRKPARKQKIMKPVDMRVCNYNENCYRKNPEHFREFNHPHLEKIMLAYSGSGDYDIPRHLLNQRRIIDQQLNIIEKHSIYPRALPKPANTSNPIVIPDCDDSDVEFMNIVDNGVLTSVDSPASTSTVKKINDPPSVASTSTKRNGKENDTQKSTPSTSKQEEQKAAEKPNTKNDNTKRNIEDFFNVVAPRGKMDEKHKKAAPYYLFYTTITSSKITHNQPLSITFQELLDASLGTLSSSLHLNFMIDIGWLLAQYYFAGYNTKPLTILYGVESEDLNEINSKKPNVQAHCVKMKNAFGNHHTKMSLLCYDDDSVRVVISTANLYIDDWENRTQGLWLSPKCPRLPDDYDITSGESKTGFKRSLINYLNSYAMPCLVSFIEKVKHADFSAINVFFVASVPGGHFDTQWGLNRIGYLLSKDCIIPKNELDNWDLITQASSIGSYGSDPNLWLTSDFQTNFCNSVNKTMLSTKKPRLKLIYPSLANVRNSHDNLLGGGCLPYGKSIHMKQTWLKSFMQEWSAVHSGRNQAMPHIKSYLRISPDASKAAFFLLTSANISKSAWGVYNKGNKALRINSYEVGVLFLPKFINSGEYFSLELSDSDRLPVPYDLPPIPYEPNDEPWVMDYLR